MLVTPHVMSLIADAFTALIGTLATRKFLHSLDRIIL
jgi:hypothetical protein